MHRAPLIFMRIRGLLLAPGSFCLPERPVRVARSVEDYPLLVPDETSGSLL